MKTTLLLWACAAFLVSAGTGLGAEPEPFGRMTVDEVSARLGQTDFFVFDANSKETYDKGHLPGARWVPFATYEESVLPKDKQVTLLFYCGNEH